MAFIYSKQQRKKELCTNKNCTREASHLVHETELYCRPCFELKFKDLIIATNLATIEMFKRLHQYFKDKKNERN